jgi:glycosyltransferase involved in cell wall biosynthesis
MVLTPVLYLCVGMNDLGGTSNHLRNIMRAAPAAGIDPILWIATKIPRKLETYFKGVPGRIVIHTNYKSLVYLPLIWRLVRDLRTHRIRVIHSFQLQSDIVGSVAAFLAPVKMRVSSFEGRLVYGSTTLRRWMLSALNRIIRPWFSFNVFISQHLLNTYGDLYDIPMGKRRLVYLGLPESWFQDPPTPRTEPDIFNVGFVGRIDAEKGYELFIETVRYLSSLNLKARFRLIGGGQREMDAIERIAKAGLQHVIEMRGWRSDIRAELDDLDIVVLPSHEEGLSFVAIESLSRKRTVIATRVGGLPEVIEDGRTGYLVEPENPRAIANAIEQVIGEWPIAKMKAEEGYLVAKMRFNSEKEVRGFMTMYQLTA